MTGRRAAAALLGAAAAGVGAWRFAVLAGHGGRAAYAMPPSVLVVAAAALAGLLLSTVVTVRAARADVTLLGILTAGLLAYGILGILSIGLPLLLLGAAACTGLVRRLCGAPPSLRLAGPALGAAVVAIVVLAGQPPVVECEPGGVTSSTPLWLFTGGASGGSGSASSDTDVHSGTVTAGGSTFTYTCAGDRMSDFRRLEHPG
jgi:hypothetical protein